MTDSEIMKALQSKLDAQAATLQQFLTKSLESHSDSIHTTLHQHLLEVDSKVANVRSEPNGSSHGSGNAIRSLKLNVPRFDGSNAIDWIFQIEAFFNFHDTPAASRLQIVSFHLEGRAASWFQWAMRNNLLTSWPVFLDAVRIRFGPTAYEDVEGDLSKLSQTGSVAEFQAQFEDLMNKVTGISEPLLISFFITGLKRSLRRELQFHRPTTLMETFAMARAYEARLDDNPSYNKTWNRSPTHTPSQNTTSSNAITQNNLTPTPTPNQSSNSSNKATTLPPLLPTPTYKLPVRHFPSAEMRDRRSKGLCFNCDEKWGPSHRCRSKVLLLMGAEDDDDDVEDHNPDEISGDISSLHALSSHLQGRSLRVSGMYNQHIFQILVDSGSTHNFIKPSLVERLGLTLSPCPRFRVATGCGTFLVCQYCCKVEPLLLQGISFSVELFVLAIEGPDMVLGFPWLQSLGKVSHDYSALTMEFTWHGEAVKLQGDTSLASQSVSLHQLQALVQSDVISGIFTLTQSGAELEPNLNEPPDFPQSIPQPVLELLQRFEKVFATPTGLPPHRCIDHRIHLIEGSKPVNVRPYRYPQFQKSEMEKLIREMLDQGIIIPSRSPFSSPVLLVRKKDGTWRFCVDYRALNAATVKDKFPIPTIDELLDELGGATVFTKLDLRAGYHQIRVHSRDTYKTAFRTHEGHFEFLVMPFGLTNAPSTFQATMNQLFSQFLRRFVIVFFDDILIYSSSLQDHVVHLEQVLKCLLTHCFYVKLSKCLFCQESIEYLGHIVSSQGVHADPGKIEAMVNWPQPNTVKQLRGFLGLTGYYRRFIANYASIAAPLTDLLRHESFRWTDAATHAFTALKQAMVAAPVLRLPDFSQEFIIETDASQFGIGAVLMQEGHPIAFFSKKLGLKMQGASVYIKELHAITEAVLKWRQYLLGHFFIIRTDHKSIKELLQQVIQTPDQQAY
ncbi:retrotransposon-related protein, partial [Trifolium pratense]